MLLASLSAGTSLPTFGPLPPTFDVVKNTGSIRVKILFLVHPAHEHRAHHPAPTDKTYSHHCHCPFKIIMHSEL